MVDRIIEQTTVKSEKLTISPTENRLINNWVEDVKSAARKANISQDVDKFILDLLPLAVIRCRGIGSRITQRVLGEVINQMVCLLHEVDAPKK